MSRLEIIGAIINEWDPIQLFPCAPSDEYQNEIIMIEKILSRNGRTDYLNLGFEIYNLFKKSFGDDVFRCNLHDCDTIANKIYESICS